MKQKLKVPKSASMYCPEKGGYVLVENCIKRATSVIGFLLLKLKKMVSKRHRRTEQCLKFTRENLFRQTQRKRERYG